MPPDAQLAETRLADARAAFVAADWGHARDAYRAAAQAAPTGVAFDGLAWSSWWLGDTGAATEAWHRAFDAFCAEANPDPAGLVALMLAAEHRIAGDHSLAGGWLGRAERLLEGRDPSPAQVWLELERAKRTGDDTHARRAASLARAIGSPALEAAATSHLGLSRIARGDVDGGLETLDEAMTQAMSAPPGEDPLAIGETCCMTLVACEQLADARRAREWSRAVVDFTRRRRYTPLSGWCGSVFAAFLVASGRWEEAEAQLERSLADYDRVGREDRVAPLSVLADLRIRQGRLDAAAQLLAGLEGRPGALGPVVRLHLARGEAQLAVETVEARLEAVGDHPAQRAPVLVLLAAVELARSSAGRADTVGAELEDLAARLGRDDLAAHAVVIRAQAARQAGRAPSCPALEAAVERLTELELPLDAASARLELARVTAGRRPALAIAHARQALAAFEDLGARRHADEAAAVLRELGAGRPAPRVDGELTRREHDVLALLGEGLSNRQIADRLVISPKTAEHHVGRILMKLGLRNRAEAAAYVVRAGISEPTARRSG